jgi:hypothetical protein
MCRKVLTTQVGENYMHIGQFTQTRHETRRPRTVHFSASSTAKTGNEDRKKERGG